MVHKAGTWTLLGVICIVSGTLSAAECPPPPTDMCFNAAACPKLDTIKPILNKFTISLFNKQLVGLASTENLVSIPMHLAMPLTRKCRSTLGTARTEVQQAFGIDGKSVTCLDILDVIVFLYRTTPHKSMVPDNADGVTVLDTWTFTDRTLKIKDEYQCLWQQMFNTTFISLDIQTDVEKARDNINPMVCNGSKYFKDVVPPKGLAKTTRFLSLNLAYLQIVWKNQFDPALTAKAPFQNLDGTTSQVDMMQFKQKSVRYTKSEKDTLAPNLPDLEVLVLPNVWTTYCLIILVPKASKDLSTLEQFLSADILEQLLEKAVNAQVTLSMPKFGLEQVIDGVAASGKVGIVTGLQNNNGDYSPMVDASNGTILPMQFLQKLTLDVNERGLKATTVTTSVASSTRSVLLGPRVEVRVDRPFLFAIRMDKSGYLTYIGRVVKL